MQISPTRSALLEAKDERRVMEEGYRFLDEKRLLLAAEIIKTFNRRDQLKAEYEPLFKKAQKAMAAAISRHGLHGLQQQPAIKRHSPIYRQQNPLIFWRATGGECRVDRECPPRRSL